MNPPSPKVPGATFAGMTVDRCGVLAQTLPVFLLAFMLEIRVLPPRLHRKGSNTDGKVTYTVAALYLGVVEMALVGAVVSGEPLSEDWQVWVWVAFLAGFVILLAPVLRQIWSSDRS